MATKRSKSIITDEHIPTSTARANLFQIIREVVETKKSVTVVSRDVGMVRIVPVDDAKGDHPALVAKVAPKAAPKAKTAPKAKPTPASKAKTEPVIKPVAKPAQVPAPKPFDLTTKRSIARKPVKKHPRGPSGGIFY